MEKNIVQKRNAELLTSIYNRYIVRLLEINVQPLTDSTYSFGQRLLKHVQGSLQMKKLGNKQVNVVYHNTMGFDEAIDCCLSETQTVVDTRQLRKLITEMEKGQY